MSVNRPLKINQGSSQSQLFRAAPRTGQVQVGDDEEVAMELKRRWIPESGFKKRTINKEKGTPVWPDFPCTMYVLSRS